MKKYWSTIRQTCLFLFLLLVVINQNLQNDWLYYITLPLLCICFVIDLFQFIGKSRAGKFRKLYLRLFDMFLLIMYVVLIAVHLIIIFNII